MAKKTLRQGRTKKAKAKSAAGEVSSGRYPFYDALKGLIHIPPGVDLTEPADPEWGERVWGDDTK